MTTLVPYGMRLGAHTDGVASTIARIDAKFPQCVCKEEEQQPGEANGFNFELFTGECKGHSPCLGATRAGDTMVYGEDAPETLRMREPPRVTRCLVGRRCVGYPIKTVVCY